MFRTRFSGVRAAAVQGRRSSLRPQVPVHSPRAHLKTVIFRLVQEGLTNAAKHSGARRARVRLALREKRVELAIEDDGRGFRPEAASRGAGLVGMRERTELAGGSFAIESRPGAGTVLRASWPLG